MNNPISNFELGKVTDRAYQAEASRSWGQRVTGEEKSDRMKVATLAVAFAIGLILLVGCGVAPAESTAVKAVEVADTTANVVKTDPVLIISADHAPGAWQAPLTQGQSVAGSYEAQPLPNGRVAIKLKNDACHLSSNVTLIVSSGDVSDIWPASSPEGQSVVGRYETQPLPNGEMAIKLQKANGVEELACQSM